MSWLSSLSTLAIGWNPEIRGVLFVVVIFVVLCGSTYLLLATNTGARLGMLLALTGLAGWMLIMGATWWVYGIGLQGKMPFWKPVEVIVGPLENARTPIAQDTSDWTSLPADDPGRGQAQAAADEILTQEADLGFDAPTDYQPQAVFDIGGGTSPDWFFNFRHDPHYALVQVQPVVPQNPEPGRPPPTPVLDEDQPTVSVLMLRDLGYRRRPAALITLGSLAVFSALAWMLHSRDRRAMAVLGRTPARTS